MQILWGKKHDISFPLTYHNQYPSNWWFNLKSNIDD